VFQFFSVLQVLLTTIHLALFTYGCTGGYFATLVTIAAEQFGTNIRATVTTTVRICKRNTNPINAAFSLLVAHYGMIRSGYIMLFILTGIAIFSLSQLKESFSKDLIMWKPFED